MNELQVIKQENEVTVLQDGSTLISQRKLAALIGVKPGTLMKHIHSKHQNINTINGLDEDTAFLVSTYFAYESKASTQQARDLIRKIGAAGFRAFNYKQAGYTIEAKPVVTVPQTFAEALRLAADQQEQIEQQQAQLTLQAPKVEYHDTVLDSSGCMTTTKIAKEFGLTARKLNSKLKDLGVQYYVDKHWVLTAKYQDNNHTKLETYTQTVDGEVKTRHTTKWTESGRKFIHNLLDLSSKNQFNKWV